MPRVRVWERKIPPLPFGPLSVREFHLEARTHDDPTEWTRVTPDLLTLDQAELQGFAIVPAIDALAVRLVCTRNAAARQTVRGIGAADCIGLFQCLFA